MKRYYLLAALALIVGCATPPPESHEDKVRRLMDVADVTRTYQRHTRLSMQVSQKYAHEMVKQYVDETKLTPELRQKHEKAVQDYVRKVQSAISAEDMIDAWKRLFGAQFTDAELDQMIRYYSSPLGQKELRVKEDATQRLTNAFHEKSRPVIEQALHDYIVAMQTISHECRCGLNRHQHKTAPAQH